MEISTLKKISAQYVRRAAERVAARRKRRGVKKSYNGDRDGTDENVVDEEGEENNLDNIYSCRKRCPIQ